ncbi:MAG: MFS transporter [Rhodobacter sp.]|nr:MFS transporter [Rhodobacter sp.]
MPILRALALSRAPAAALMAVGVLWGGFAALVPDIKAATGASDAALGAALLMSAVGGMGAMALAPWAGRRLGRLALPAMGAALTVAFLYPAFAWDVVSLGAAMFAMGATVALLDVTANVEISAREAREGVHLMNVNHAMFSFAFAGAAYGTGLARQAGAGPDEVLPVLALVGAGLALAMWSPGAADPPEDGRAGIAGSGAPWGVIGLTGLILFASFIGENATEAWSALHLERTLGAPPGEGGLGPAVLGLVMGIGRMSGQVVADRLGHARLIFTSAALGVTGALTIAAAPSVPVAVLGVAVAALGMAVIVPSANSMLGARVTGAQRAHALSRAWMVGIFGFFIGPAMMGGIAELLGLRMSFAAISAIVALILPAVVLLDRRPRA